MNDAEKTWLEENKNLCLRCEWNYYDNPCIRYGRLGKSGSCPGFEPRGHEYDYRDAAEFEARVAAELARPNMSMCPCWMHDCDYKRSGYGAVCRSCRLKYARLSAEQDMEADHDRR